MIDPRAVVHEQAQLDEGVEVGPFAVIGGKVKIGAGTTVCAHAVIEDHVTIGRDNYIGTFAHIGGPPQHVAYKGEETTLTVGDGNRIREYVTMHRGTAAGRGDTRVGSDNFIMIGSHIAHDCVLGDRITMANLATLGGHVVVEDDVVFGGFSGLHQYCRAGRVAMLAAGTKATKDVPPFSMVGGEPPRFVGLNRVGLRRVNMDEQSRSAVRKAYRIIFKKGEKLEDGLARAEQELGEVAEVRYVINFIKESSRGVLRD
ncbi:MAG: acyl-ACP--UDP-N-acetylglucosamine O-acyltransferase [bacterium]